MNNMLDTYMNNDSELDNDFIPATESLHSDAIKNSFDEVRKLPMFELQNATMGCEKRRGTNVPLIRTTDNKEYRVYVTAAFYFSDKIISSLCKFLDTRSSDETVIFVLGTKMGDWQSHSVGAIISSMKSCRANVKTIAAGYCSITETIIWCFGKEREIQHYGALSFGVSEIVKYCPAYLAYFKTFFKRAVEINVLTQEQMDSLLSKGKEIMMLYKDIERIPEVNVEATDDAASGNEDE